MTMTEAKPRRLRLTPEEQLRLVPRVRELCDLGKSDPQAAAILDLTSSVVRGIRIVGRIPAAARRPGTAPTPPPRTERKTPGPRAGDEVPCPAGNHPAPLGKGKKIGEHQRLSSVRVGGVFPVERCPASGRTYRAQAAA